MDRVAEEMTNEDHDYIEHIDVDAVPFRYIDN